MQDDAKMIEGVKRGRGGVSLQQLKMRWLETSAFVPTWGWNHCGSVIDRRETFNN